MIKRMYNWMGTFVDKKYGTWVLAGFFFIEAIFFLPTDPLLILFCVKKPRRSLYYATIATVASVLGAIVAYFLGYGLWELIGQKIVAFFTTPETFEHLCTRYRLYQNWAVLIAGFTPVPYKIVTLTAGFCKLALLPFILVSIIARGARFYLVGGIIYIWGKKISEYIDRYFNLLVLLFFILVVVSVWMLK